MAFLKFSRDKRGVENFFIVQPTTNRRGKVRPRVLYWFRSPPDVKVGRQPFDPSIRRALEAQNPDVNFDWRSIVETPIPSADADKWRERRRAEKAAKHAAAAEAAAEAAAAGDTTDAAATANGDPESGADDGEAEPTMIEAADGEAEPITASATAPDAPRDLARDPGRDPNRKRRRRRRGGGGRPSTGLGTSPSTGPASSDEPSGD